MADIVTLAFQTDATRVATIMLGREKSRCTFPDLKITETHHQLSHCYRDEETIRKLSAIDRYHIEIFAYLMRNLDALKSAAGESLLDSSILVYGSGLSDGSQHRHDHLPLVVAGGGHQTKSISKLTDLHASVLRKFTPPPSA